MILFRSAENIAFHIKDTLKICQEILEQKPEQIFLTMLWENWSISQTIVWADNFFHHNKIPTTWIVNSWSKDSKEWLTLKNSVVFFDFVPWRVYKLIVEQKKSFINPVWNSNASQYLFLTGKPDKMQRIGLLYKLYQKGLLQNCNYSLFMHSGMIENSKKFIPDLSDAEFLSFVKNHTRNPDNANYLEQSDSIHYGGMPYDHTMYSNSLFRLVSETYMHLPKPWITEKTWLTILNRNPFVIAGDANSCKYLQALGFYTFDNIFDIPTYDNIADHEQRLDHVIAHVEQWLAGNFDKTAVANMVEHNYNRFIELVQEEQKNLESKIGHPAEIAIDTRDILIGK